MAAVGLLLAACAGEGEGGSLYSCAGAAPGEPGDAVGGAAIEVLSPGGDAYLAGESVIVSWRTRGDARRVHVDLFADGEPVLSIARDIEDAGAIEWTTPVDVAPGGAYRVRVTAVDSGDAGEGEVFAIDNWKYRRSITVTPPAGEPSVSRVALVELATGGFDFGRAASNGADLRFASRADRDDGFDVPYYVERWDASAGARVWIRLPATAAGQPMTLHMFYGAAAPDASDRDAVLVDRFDSVADIALGGDKTIDVFRLNAGHTLRVEPGESLTIRAQLIEIEGTIDGSGAGTGGGAIGYAAVGPGAGGLGDTGGGGGGGYGGAGGTGGYHWPYYPGLGGAAHGTAMGVDIAPGGGGGGSYDARGGNGGGAISLVAHTVILDGAVLVDGQPGDDCLYATCGGGGAGGGILVRAHDLDVGGALSARGGDGGNGSGYDDGGGGGGGGRIKLFAARDSSFTGSAAVQGGAGGQGGIDGDAGAAGTVYTGVATSPASEVLVGGEALVFP